MRRGDLSDDQWAALKPLLPAAATTDSPFRSKQMLIDGFPVASADRGSVTDLPPCYGLCQTVYGLFRRWQRLGVWAGLLTKFQARADARGRIGWTVHVDSTICRTHQHAAGAGRDGRAQKEPPQPRESCEPR
ncbi:transposase [Streptomyces vastus]|uniref:Insertion element IS402-like domain-containing protein n=1 Tax=Streptomyces vastus TaxID=285451 RepID=A0ABN3RWV6_9ACTN